MKEADKGRHVDLTDGKRHKLTINWFEVDEDPQAEQRLRDLFEITFSILRREQLLGKGLTYEQVTKVLKSRRRSQSSFGLGGDP